MFNNSVTKTGGEEGMSVVVMKLGTIAVVWAQVIFIRQNITKPSG